jgi:hypothetical protein
MELGTGGPGLLKTQTCRVRAKVLPVCFDTANPQLNPQPNPQKVMSYMTSACLGSPRGLVSRCKT